MPEESDSQKVKGTKTSKASTFSQRKQNNIAELNKQREATECMKEIGKNWLCKDLADVRGCLGLILWFYLAMSDLVLVFKRALLFLCEDWVIAEWE